jgi:hypothetical protein
MVAVMMPVSSIGYVNRLKLLPLPFDAARYGPRKRDLLSIFMIRGWPNSYD